MKVFLDDVRDAPPGYERVYWPEEAIAFLTTGRVELISLDHDLGDDAHGTGYDVLLWIEKEVFLHGFVPPKMYIHSDNTPARNKMNAAIEAINRQYRKNLIELSR